jgi:hypothetical protein
MQDQRQGQQGPGQQQQRRKKVQRGLEDNVKRTVYISYIDQQVGGWVQQFLQASAASLCAQACSTGPVCMCVLQAAAASL